MGVNNIFSFVLEVSMVFFYMTEWMTLSLGIFIVFSTSKKINSHLVTTVFECTGRCWLTRNEKGKWSSF